MLRYIPSAIKCDRILRMSADPIPDPIETKATLELEKLKADIAKAAADRQKAELEIGELKGWYRRPAVLQPLATIVIGLVTALIGLANGWFSTKLESLSNKQAEVRRDIEKLESGRSELKSQLVGLTSERNQLQARLKDVSAQAAALSAKVNELQPEAVRANRYKADLDRLKQSLTQVSTQAANAAAGTQSDSTKHAEPFSISGTVVDAVSFYPISRAEVTLVEVGSDGVSKDVSKDTTVPNGRFVFTPSDEMRTHSFVLRAHQSGYRTGVSPVPSTGDNRDLTIRLMPERSHNN